MGLRSCQSIPQVSAPTVYREKDCSAASDSSVPSGVRPKCEMRRTIRGIEADLLRLYKANGTMHYVTASIFPKVDNEGMGGVGKMCVPKVREFPLTTCKHTPNA